MGDIHFNYAFKYYVNLTFASCTTEPSITDQYFIAFPEQPVCTVSSLD